MPKDVRQDLRQTAEDVELSQFFRDAVGAEKTLYPKCAHCGKANNVSVPDWNARASVIRLMLEQGYGRPTTQDEATINTDKPATDLTPAETQTLRAHVSALLRAHAPARDDVAPAA